jgi:putative Mg2+ transporter-C (MgtC) family protein
VPGPFQKEKTNDITGEDRDTQMLNISSEQIDIAGKLLTATVLGGLIGIEREFHGRAAGLRTHILVCLGSTIIMACANTMFDRFVPQGADSVFRIDPWRIAAGIVTGIGFLGGGTILKSNDLIRGLTTAACVWFMAAIGIIVGLGQYIPAIIGTLIGLAVLVGLDPVGHKIPSIKYSRITIISEMDPSGEIESTCLEILKRYSINVQNTSISIDVKARQKTMILYTRSRHLRDKQHILKQMVAIPYVEHVAW